MRIFCKALLFQCRSYKLDAELIIVEWNPDPSKELLHEILPAPQEDDTLTIRYVVVPPSVHYALSFSEKFPLYQMIAKNVGIRRAESPWVVCTNVDLLFSDELMAFLSRGKFEPHTYYRANRCDIPKSIDEDLGVKEQLRFSKSHVLQRLGKNRFYPEMQDTTGYIYTLPYGGWFMSVPKKVIALLGRQTTADLMDTIDSDACGDFTMMSKVDWNNIQGYYELEAYSIHIDSLALLCAKALGMSQVILDKDAVTFHISHDNGWELDDPIRKLYNDIAKPKVDWSSVYALGKKMIEQKQLIQVNDANWGFASELFTEYLLRPGCAIQILNNE